jgi:hypothetical protein
MEGCRPLLALPVGAAWVDRGEDLPAQREIDEDDFYNVWNTLETAYNTRHTSTCDVYALVDYFHQMTFSQGSTLNVKKVIVVDVLRALKAHGEASTEDMPRNAWRVWGGPPDDDRWWANLWKVRDEWEQKRDRYAQEQNRDYGKVYKRRHVDHMHKLFGAYDFKKEETLDALKVGARTYKLVDDLLTRYNDEIMAADADRPLNKLTIEVPSLAIMIPESYGMYKSRSAPLSEMTVRGEHVWQHYDVPRNRHGDMLLLGVNMGPLHSKMYSVAAP